MKNVMMGTYIRGDDLINFNFSTDLSTADKLKFVNSIVDILVDERRYNSVIRDLVTDFYIVDIFTDIDTVELKQSQHFINDVEKFLEETNIVDIVKANASPIIFDELNDAIDKSIEYITGIHTNPLNDALASLMSMLEKKLNEFDMTSMMAMAQKFSAITGELTPEKVVNAYIDSDMHQKNLAEIAESKAENADTEVISE